MRLPPIPFKNTSSFNFILEVETATTENFSDRAYDIVAQSSANCMANSPFFVNLQLKSNMNYRGLTPKTDTIRKVLILKVKNSTVYFHYPIEAYVYESSNSSAYSWFSDKNHCINQRITAFWQVHCAFRKFYQCICVRRTCLDPEWLLPFLWWLLFRVCLAGEASFSTVIKAGHPVTLNLRFSTSSWRLWLSVWSLWLSLAISFFSKDCYLIHWPKWLVLFSKTSRTVWHSCLTLAIIGDTPVDTTGGLGVRFKVVRYSRK